MSEKLQYCVNCLNVNTRPNIRFSDDGRCFPCAAFNANHDLDKSERDIQLEEIVSFARKNSGSEYDCILGVSGGKDSTRQALHIKNNFGLKPLLVSMSYPPEQISKRGVDNLSNLIGLGFDCVNISCCPQTWRDAMRFSFRKFGNWAKSTEHALFASIPRVAIAYQIPLMFWGESAAYALGEMGVFGSKPYDGNRLKYSNTLAGGDIDWLVSSGIPPKELIQFAYPSDEEMARVGIQIVFMDYFMRDFSPTSNGTFSALNGLTLRDFEVNLHSDFFGVSCLDEDFININMFIRYLKFGFGMASDIVNQEIRLGRMSRQAGIDLVKRFDGNYDPGLVNEFCKYIAIPVGEFWQVVDKYANTSLFEKVAEGEYRPKFEVGVGL